MPLLKDRTGVTVSHLVRCHIPDRLVHVLGVVPLHEVAHPLAGIFKLIEGIRIGDMVLHCLEQRLDKRVVVAGPWPAVGDSNIELLQKRHERNAFHRVTVISMERLEFHPASVQYPSKQRSAVLFAFFFVNRPADVGLVKDILDNVSVIE